VAKRCVLEQKLLLTITIGSRYQRLPSLCRGITRQYTLQARLRQLRVIVFVGLPACLQRLLQTVLNAAARLVFYY